MRLERLGGVAAIALLATMGSASAVVITPFTNSPLLNLGVGNGGGFQNAVNLGPGGILAGTGIATIMFNDGTPLSGVYSGTVPNVATTPFPPFDGLPVNLNQNYLVAQPGGSVTVAYATAQTSFEILWGTIDPQDSRNLVITTTGGDNITGQQILTACNGIAGTTNCEVTISNLMGGTSFGYTASDATGQLSAFEFVPGVVPEPASLAILGSALIGFGLLRRRKTA